MSKLLRSEATGGAWGELSPMDGPPGGHEKKQPNGCSAESELLMERSLLRQGVRGKRPPVDR
jgi:hypothetical protein